MNKDKNMNSVTKSRSTSSTFADNTSIALNSQNALSFQRISFRQLPPTTSRNEQSYTVMNSIDNDSLTRSILIDNAAQQGGFLPCDYRIKNTFESIYQKRTYHKPSSKLPPIPPPVFNRRSKRSDAFGNITSSMSKLAEQRLILREKVNRKKHNSTPIIDKHEKASHTMNETDFAADIPNALELILKTTTRRSTVEKHVLEILKRERLQQARYRILPINRVTINLKT